jgi:transposase-like protein
MVKRRIDDHSRPPQNELLGKTLGRTTRRAENALQILNVEQIKQQRNS